MSPEERAAVVRESVMEAIFHDGSELQEIDALIAQAIRDAENEAVAGRFPDHIVFERTRYLAMRENRQRKFAQALRDADNEALERAWREITMIALANSEDVSAEFTNGLTVAADAIRSLKSQEI